MILIHCQYIWLRKERYRCLAGTGITQAGKTHIELLLLQTPFEFFAWALKQLDQDIRMRLPKCL